MRNPKLRFLVYKMCVKYRTIKPKNEQQQTKLSNHAKYVIIVTLKYNSDANTAKSTGYHRAHSGTSS